MGFEVSGLGKWLVGWLVGPEALFHFAVAGSRLDLHLVRGEERSLLR